MIRNAVLVLVLALAVAFAFLNWDALAAPMALSLGFATVTASLGAVLLVVAGLLGVAFGVWALSLQAAVLAESRRHAKEMQAQRELADRAEASRFVELREFVRTALEQTGNTLSAQIGQLEDRLERGRVAMPSDAGAVDEARLLPPRR